MKICYLTHDLHPQTGIGIFSRNLVECVALKRPDWEVAVLVEEVCGHAREKGIIKTDKRHLLKTIFSLRKQLKQYDIVHALDGYPYGCLAILGTLGTRKRVYITAVGTGAIRMFGHSLIRPILAYCYRRADRVFSISEYTARKVQEHVPDVAITPVLLGINYDELEPREGDDARTHKLNLDKKKPYLLTVGSFKPRKGQREAMRGFIQAVKEAPELNYVLEGDDNNEYSDEIKKLVEAAGVARNVFFVGNVSKSELRTLYNHASFFLMLPQEVADDADIEGFGMVFLDAAAAGLPIIASTEGPSAEATAPGANSILVDPRDPDAVARAMLCIARDDALRKKMSDASRVFAHKMSWNRTAEQYFSHYEQ